MTDDPDASGWSVADPFDLPDWLGEEPLQWATTDPLATSLVGGALSGPSGRSLALDLLCADVAYPTATLDERLRHDAHQAWHFGQVLVLVRGGRHTLAVPTTSWDTETVCEALRRFTKAIGVPPSQLAVVLRL